MVQKLAWVFAVVFIVVGIGGFIPGLTVNGHLLGIFEVNALHNVIHLLSGIAAAIAAATSAKYARLYFKVFGVVYALVTVIGFVQGDTLLGLIGVNLADNILHLAIAALALFIGFHKCSNAKCKMCNAGGGAGHEEHQHGDHTHHEHDGASAQQ